MSSRFDQMFSSAEARMLEIFGETHIWNGQEIMAMPNHSTRGAYENENSDPDGVLRQKITLDIPAKSITHPLPWEEIELNGESWLVQSAEQVGGLLTITIFRDYA